MFCRFFRCFVYRVLRKSLPCLSGGGALVGRRVFSLFNGGGKGTACRRENVAAIFYFQCPVMVVVDHREQIVFWHISWYMAPVTGCPVSAFVYSVTPT